MMTAAQCVIAGTGRGDTVGDRDEPGPRCRENRDRNLNRLGS